MRRPTSLLAACTVAFVGLCGAAFAQTAPAPAPDATTPPAGAMAPTGHGAKGRCMQQHLPQLRAEMKAHMQTWAAANPSADAAARKAERQSFHAQQETDHASDIAAARQACGVATP